MHRILALLLAVLALSLAACNIPSEEIAVRRKKFRSNVVESCAAPMRPRSSKL